MVEPIRDYESITLMDEAISSLSSVCGNVKGLIGDLVQTPDNFNFSTDINRLNQALKTLKSNIEHFVGPFFESKKKEMTSTLEELEVLRTKYKNLQCEWDNQQEHLGRIQGDLFKMRAQLKNQSSFCASLGAIMGNLMWKTSRLPNVVEILLSTNRVSEFLCIVSGSLDSFMETYRNSLPDVTTNETQFILSLVGIVANMAGTGEGRQFLVTDPNGRELVCQMLTLLPNIPEESGDSLKRVVLMCLYNLSINQMGLIMLLENKSLLGVLSRSIETDTSPELRLLALRLIQSLTMQISSLQVYENITQSIPIEAIQKLTNTTDADMRILARSIITSLQKSGTKLGARISQMSMGWDKCRLSNSSDNRSSCSLVDSISQNNM